MKTRVEWCWIIVKTLIFKTVPNVYQWNRFIMSKKGFKVERQELMPHSYVIHRTHSERFGWYRPKWHDFEEFWSWLTCKIYRLLRPWKCQFLNRSFEIECLLHVVDRVFTQTKLKLLELDDLNLLIYRCLNCWPDNSRERTNVERPE